MVLCQFVALISQTSHLNMTSLTVILWTSPWSPSDHRKQTASYFQYDAFMNSSKISVLIISCKVFSWVSFFCQNVWLLTWKTALISISNRCDYWWFDEADDCEIKFPALLELSWTHLSEQRRRGREGVAQPPSHFDMIFFFLFSTFAVSRSLHPSISLSLCL